MDGVYAAGSKGTLDLIKKHFTQMTWEAFNYPKNIEKRGLDNLANFPHRDDVKKVWKVMEEFVNEYVDKYYTSDADVQEDFELQDFVNEISENGFVHLTQMQFPKKFMIKEQLKDLLVKLMFTTTSRHSSFNFFEYQRFIPNAPYAIEVFGLTNQINLV